jgi:outer membrane protein assembly factor BamA
VRCLVGVIGIAFLAGAGVARADDQPPSSLREIGIKKAKPPPPPPSVDLAPPPLPDMSPPPPEDLAAPDGGVADAGTDAFVVAPPPPPEPPRPAQTGLVEIKARPGAVTPPPPSGDGVGERIVSIRVVDNTKTDRNTIEFISALRVGDTLTGETLDAAREHLLSVGLFKEVKVSTAPKGGGVEVTISAKDKLSWIIAPIASYAHDNYGGGLAFAESNLFGQNKKLLIVGEYTLSEKLILVGLLDPNIRHTRFYYRVDLLVRRDTIREYARGHDGDPLVSRGTNVDTYGAGGLVGVNFTRHLHFDLRLKIYYDVINTPSCYNTTTKDGSGTPDVIAADGRCQAPAKSGWDNTLTFNFTFDNRSKIYGIIHGFLVSANYQYGAHWLGDQFDYHLLTLQGMFGRRFFKEHNLILRGSADVFFDPPFKLEAEVGGQASERGYVYRQYRGDTALRFTLEYHVPLFTIKGLSFRALGFYDGALTWFRSLPAQTGPDSRIVTRGDGFRAFLPDTPSGVTRDSWRNGIGIGLRMYFRGIVLPLVGVDFAYGFEANNYQVYLALGSSLD